MKKDKAALRALLCLLISTLPLQAEQESTRFWLAKDLARGQAVIWYLHHAGWAVKTKNQLLIFDYWPETRPLEKPSLANGFIDPDEIKDLKVNVFTSHAHEDHFDQAILNWQAVIPQIQYVFGWQAEQGERCLYLGDEHASTSMAGLEIRTIHHRFDGIPEAAFLVKIDGLVIYHSGDHACSAEKLNKTFQNNIDHLAGLAPFVDIAFISIFCQRDGSWVNSGDRYTLEKLRPRVLLPMHSGGYEKEYRQFAEAAAKLKIKTRILAAGRRGECFFYRRQ